MKRSLLPLVALVALALPAAAQNPAHRVVRRAAAPAVVIPAQAQPAQAQPAQPQQTPPAPTPPQPGICCCRVWSHGWQYSWRPNAECTAQSGSCVTPDHC